MADKCAGSKPLTAVLAELRQASSFEVMMMKPYRRHWSCPLRALGAPTVTQLRAPQGTNLMVPINVGLSILKNL